VPREDLGLLVVHHVPCARDGDDLEPADVLPHIVGGSRRPGAACAPVVLSRLLPE